MQWKTAVFGASGYVGGELIRLLAGHPHFKLEHVAAHSQAGRCLGDVLPSIVHPLHEMRLASIDDDVPEGIHLAFTALPHGAAATTVSRLISSGIRVVDLSADFRHKDPADYEAAYHIPHPCPSLLKDAVYGLTEHVRPRLRSALLVANPGCYPTSVLLPLIPLLKEGLVNGDGIIVDAKSGASGAGRGPNLQLLFCEVNEGVRAYGLPRHRHAWEMEEWASCLSGTRVRIRFTPHLLPMNRGMLTTLHLNGRDVERWKDVLRQAYRDEPFVRVLPQDVLPGTKAVVGSNRCDISVIPTSHDEAVIVSCLDNLVKGAAGQALQNANAMFGLPETCGLPQQAIWP